MPTSLSINIPPLPLLLNPLVPSTDPSLGDSALSLFLGRLEVAAVAEVHQVTGLLKRAREKKRIRRKESEGWSGALSSLVAEATL